MIILLVLMIVFAVLAGIGIYLNKSAFYTKTWEYQATFDNEVKKGFFDPDFYYQLKKEELYIGSTFGYPIHAIWIPMKASDKTVIMTHGYTYSLFGSVKYMNIFLQRGYNVLMYDHRYHGKSGGENCTMGFREKDDLKTVTDWVVHKKGEESLIVTYGESLGGATVLLHGAMDNRVAAIIADCPYKSVFDEFTYQLKKEYNLPAFPLIYIADWFSPLFIQTRFSHISPIKAVKKIDCPVLFIHGDEDKYIPPHFSVDMYNQKPGKKQLYLAKGADHAQSFIVDRGAYTAQIHDFLSEIETNTKNIPEPQKATPLN